MVGSVAPLLFALRLLVAFGSGNFIPCAFKDSKRVIDLLISLIRSLASAIARSQPLKLLTSFGVKLPVKGLTGIYTPFTLMKETKDHEYWKEVESEARNRLEVVQTMLDSLEAQRAERLNEKRQLEQLLSSIAPFTTPNPMDESDKLCLNFGLVSSLEGLDLTQAIRKVLKENKRYMTAREIRDMLGVNGYDLQQHPNHLAAVHAVLKRFVESEAVIEARDEKGVAYQWSPVPEWYRHITKNGPLNFSSLTPRQRRQARAMDLVDESKE